MERTLILFKPDAIQRGLVGEILSVFEKKGFKIVGTKMLKMTPELAKRHYAHLVDKPFYPDLERFMTSQPIIAMVIEGVDVVSVVRDIVGATNARQAAPGTIRARFSNSVSRNVIHASDSVETAKKEIANFFSEEELFDYELVLKPFFYAGDEE